MKNLMKVLSKRVSNPPTEVKVSLKSDELSGKFSQKLINVLAKEYIENNFKIEDNEYSAYIAGFKKCIEIIGGEVVK